MRRARRIDVFTHDLPGVVDAEWSRLDRARNIDLRKDAVIEQEPVWQLESGRVGVVAVYANDLTLDRLPAWRRFPWRQGNRSR